MKRGISVAIAGAVSTWSLIIAAVICESAVVAVLIIVGLIAGSAVISVAVR